VSRILKETAIDEVRHYGMRGFSGEAVIGKKDGARYVSCSGRQLNASFQDNTWQGLFPTGKTCYLSIDLDVIDPAFAPGVGTPVPFGLDPNRLSSMLQYIATANKVVGFDLVELCPSKDQGTMTASMAFHLVTSVLSWSLDKSSE
jgi:agmatinase